MAVYSIRDLEKFSGIKAHTLRIWEQRYGIIKPERTPSNIRYYSDNDLKLLLNIVLLNRNGIKISKIAKMSRIEIVRKVGDFSEINSEFYTQLEALTISTIEMDEAKFNHIISSNIERLGFEKTMLQIIYPFLNKLNLLWLAGSVKPAQENFMTHLISHKIIVAIDKHQLGPNSRKFILYLPEGENQELTMLFINYILKSRGHQTVYLGRNISLLDLNDVYRIHQPNYIFTMLTEEFSRQPIRSYVNSLAESFPKCRVLLSSYEFSDKDPDAPRNVSILNSLSECMLFLNAI